MSTMLVDEAIDKFVVPGRAPLPHRLNRMVRLAAAPLTAWHMGHGQPNWFGVYDALVGDPTRARGKIRSEDWK